MLYYLCEPIIIEYHNNNEYVTALPIKKIYIINLSIELNTTQQTKSMCYDTLFIDLCVQVYIELWNNSICSNTNENDNNKGLINGWQINQKFMVIIIANKWIFKKRKECV